MPHITASVRPLKQFVLLGAFLFAVALLVSTPPRPAYAADVIDHCGPITADQTWAGDGFVHVITCKVTVNHGVTLTIEAGAILKLDDFGDHVVPLFVQGVVHIAGTQANPVYLTSIHDDTVGDDTNYNGGATTPAQGDWWGMLIDPLSLDYAGSSVVDHAIIRYADYGLSLGDAAPLIRFSTFTENGVGLMVVAGDPPLSPPRTLTCNNFLDNLWAGIQNDVPGYELIAENQWWGSVDGPPDVGGPAGLIDVTPWSLLPCQELPDLVPTLTDSPDPVARGRQLTYTAVVTNQGYATAIDVTFDAWNGEGWLAWDSAVSTQGVCIVGVGVHCDLGVIPAGETATVTFKGTVADAAGSLLTTHVVAGNKGAQIDGTNDEAIALTRVAHFVFLPGLAR